MNEIIEYIPILTTLFSFYFTAELFKHYRIKRKKYLLWWNIGVLTFGLGTLAESINVLFGWTGPNLKYWYITGALLGGFPLAQGSVYLLMKEKFANATAAIFMTVILSASILVIMSPLKDPGEFDHTLTGKVFEWQWVRYFSPLINLYSFIFLFGGAVYSAIKYYGQKDKRAHFRGNIFIAAGALLPGIGGTFTRMGYVNVLFVTELIGLVLIYSGYKIIRLNRTGARAR